MALYTPVPFSSSTASTDVVLYRPQACDESLGGVEFVQSEGPIGISGGSGMTPAAGTTQASMIVAADGHMLVVCLSSKALIALGLLAVLL